MTFFKAPIFIALTLALAAQNRQASPISDNLRSEIAIAQRDYLIARIQYDAATAKLQAKTRDATAACEASQMRFEPATLACTPQQSEAK